MLPSGISTSCWRFSVGFISWPQVNGKVFTTHMCNSISFKPSGKRGEKSSFFIQYLSKSFGFEFHWYSSHLYQSTLLKLFCSVTRLGWMYTSICLRWPLFIFVVWAEILIMSSCSHSLGWLPIIPVVHTLLWSPPRLSRADLCDHFSLALLDHLLWRKSDSLLSGHSSCLWGGPRVEVQRLRPTMSTNLLCEWATLEADLTAPAKPSDDCSPGRYLNPISWEVLRQNCPAKPLPNSKPTYTVQDNKCLLLP